MNGIEEKKKIFFNVEKRSSAFGRNIGGIWHSSFWQNLIAEHSTKKANYYSIEIWNVEILNGFRSFLRRDEYGWYLHVAEKMKGRDITITLQKLAKKGGKKLKIILCDRIVKSQTDNCKIKAVQRSLLESLAPIKKQFKNDDILAVAGL